MYPKGQPLEEEMWPKRVFYFLGLCTDQNSRLASFPSTAGKSEPSLISQLSRTLIKEEYFAGV